MRTHLHVFVTGLGMYGDAMTCIICGYSKYPEILPKSFTFCPVYDGDKYPHLLKAANEAIKFARTEEKA